jgi:hypothetical protein
MNLMEKPSLVPFAERNEMKPFDFHDFDLSEIELSCSISDHMSKHCELSNKNDFRSEQNQK